MKMTSKKVILLILPILLIGVLFSDFIENNVKAYDILDNTEWFDFVPINGTEFQSENLHIGNETAFIYTTLSEKTGNSNKDEYIITIGKVRGIKDNRYEIVSIQPQMDQDLLSDEYINVYDYPQREIKKGDSYYGSIYVGTVPISCKSVEIQGTEATLVEQSFDLNGKTAKFYLYYCAIEENEAPYSASVVCTREDGKTFDVVIKKY